MAMTWGWFNLITISTYFDIFRQHLSGLNVLQLFFSNARFFEATLVPLSIVHCPSLWSWHSHWNLYVRTLWSLCSWCVCCLVEWLHTWDLWGKNRKLATERSYENWADILSCFFPPSSEVGLQSFIQKPPTYVASLVTNHQSLIHHQNHVALQHNLKAAAANCKTAHPCPESLNCHWNHLKP